MLPHNHLDLSAEQIKLIGDLLVPLVRDAIGHELRGEFALLRTNLAEQTDRQSTVEGERFRALEARVAELEALKWKAVAAWGAIVLAGTWAFDAGWEWVKARLLGLK